MTRIQQRILIQNSLLGLLLTVLVLAADWGGEDGLLSDLERRIYDVRAKVAQNYTPPPTADLLHVDMDDQSFQAIGPWPWPRSILAELTAEIKRAGAKVIGFDVIFSEAQDADFKPIDAEFLRTESKPDGAPRQQFRGVFEEIEHNREFGRALRDFNGAMLPIAFLPRVAESELFHAVLDNLIANPAQTRAEVESKMRAKGNEWDDSAKMLDIFLQAREVALLQRIGEALRTIPAAPNKPGSPPTNYFGLPTEEQLQRIIMPDEVQRVKKALPDGYFHQMYETAVSFHILQRVTRAAPSDLIPAIPYRKHLPPIPVLADAITTTSFVDYLADRDGVVRAVPLFLEADGRLYPQFALMLLCMHEGIDVHQIEIGDDEIVIPRPDGSRLRVPTFQRYSNSTRKTHGMYTYIPWFGPSENGWLYMYDWGAFSETRQHETMLLFWEALQTDKQLTRNLQFILPALKELFDVTGDPRFKELEDKPLSAEQAFAYLNDLVAKGELDGISEQAGGIDRMSEEEFDKFQKGAASDEERAVAVSIRRALLALRKIAEMRRRVDVLRRSLREKTEGKAVIVGWTAVGRLDIVQTSLHARCPGPMVHGVVFSALKTGNLWRRASPWLTRGITLLIGVLATIVAIRFHPFTALVSSVGLVALYGMVNFVYHFDYLNLVVGAAAPALTVTLVWSGCTLLRFIVERAERKHIENRFRSYVDPALVNYVIDHPDQANVMGQKKELTVIFTDLQGFTTLSERLQERTVSMLNDYLGRMVPIVSDPKLPPERQGFLNKFLGDGIMFFFGAPMDNQWHALDAVSTVLRMQQAMGPFNEELKKQDLPTVKMRAGINTGNVIVGDAGIAQRSDYTVLGDTVNTSARLESANKATGTLVMMGGRTYELVKDVFLCRPIAKLQVVGKTEGTWVYEPLAPHTEATDHQKKLVEMTKAMVDAYTAGQFAKCLQRVRELDEFIKPTKLQLLYQLRCEEYLKNPPGPEFNGAIALTEK